MLALSSEMRLLLASIFSREPSLAFFCCALTISSLADARFLCNWNKVELSPLMDFPSSLQSFLIWSNITLMILTSNTSSTICFLSVGDSVRNDLNFFIEMEIIFENVAIGISTISFAIYSSPLDVPYISTSKPSFQI